MLASIIDRLTALVSKYLVIGFFVPVLMFAFIAGAILYEGFSRFRDWTRLAISGTAAVFSTVAILIGLSILAYLFSVLSTFLREILEGKHLLEVWPALMQRLQTRQQERLTRIQTEYEVARREHEFTTRRKLSWRKALSDAASSGMQEHKNASAFDSSSQAAREVDKLQLMRAQAQALSSEEIEGAISLLVTALAANDESFEDGKGHETLREKRFSILELIDYAEDYWSSVELRQFNERQSRFGLSFVAPTAMGNVAQTMQAYAVTRYQLNLEKFWGDLQTNLPTSNRDFFSQLQDAKTQLDFLVTCYWLSVLVTLACGSILLESASATLFLAVVLGGPLGAYFFYLLGVKSYQSFAELVRIGVDLYRFQLLDSLHIARPRTARDERAIWTVLQRLSYPGSEGTELSYKSDIGA